MSAVQAGIPRSTPNQEQDRDLPILVRGIRQLRKPF
jgi:hypothetical protein